MQKKMRKKYIEPICGNCKLYSPKKGVCSVVVLMEGQRLNVPVDPGDHCFFEQKYFDPQTNCVEDLNEIKEVKFWVEDEKGRKTNKNGTVKIEYPEGFFGVESQDDPEDLA
jgi:hypothetical protein